MMFTTKCLPEPDLEFGDDGRHIDPRYGLMTYGPLQAKPGDLIRIGIVGTSETVDGMAHFMERAMTGIEGANERLGNLNPGFPGIGNKNPFRCRFEIEAGATKTILKKDVKAIQTIPKHPDAVRAAVDMFIDQARALLESSARPEVIMLALPKPIIEKVVNATAFPEDEDEEDADDGPTDLIPRPVQGARTCAQRANADCLADSVGRCRQDLQQNEGDRPTSAGSGHAGLEYIECDVLQGWQGALAVASRRRRLCDQLPRNRFLSRSRRSSALDHTAQMFDERGNCSFLRGARRANCRLPGYTCTWAWRGRQRIPPGGRSSTTTSTTSDASSARCPHEDVTLLGV